MNHDQDLREEYVVALLDLDGFITLASRRVFANPEDAYAYAKTLAMAYRTYIIKGCWRALRTTE
jgi:hypothetical protein